MEDMSSDERISESIVLTGFEQEIRLLMTQDS